MSKNLTEEKFYYRKEQNNNIELKTKPENRAWMHFAHWE